MHGLDIVSMEAAGTGAYAQTNGGLEPPDQMLCVGNGYVMEGVNTAIEVFNDRGVPVVGAVPLTQFMDIASAKNPAPASFTSDPRCIYDARTERFVVIVLEIDSTNGVLNYPFLRSHTYIAVSESATPTGVWNVYGFDVTDDGLLGTPAHATCPCLDDQPLLGSDAYGIYLSANEYSDAEVLPVASPVNPPYGTLPDFRNGQSQVYALPKRQLEDGVAQIQVTSFDTANTPLPPGSSTGAVWSELQPAFSPPEDGSVEPTMGVEWLMSQLDFDGQGDNRVAVWAITNTASLGTTTPAPSLTAPSLVTTLQAGDTYRAPTSGVDQKAGDHPLCSSCPEEQLNPNDDRMNEVMLANGELWGAVNTDLPAIQDGAPPPEGDHRTGIMYFEVAPAVGSDGSISATMARDGYISVPRESVLFPSIGATPSGATVATFTLSGVDSFPSVAWARLDDVPPRSGPTVHVDAVGAAPEDGFTGYGTCGSLGFQGSCPALGSNVSRWGDYSFSAVDERGCVWAAAEWIPGNASDGVAGDWGTWIHRIAPPGCVEPPLTPAVRLVTNPCGPLFNGIAGSDDYLGTATNHAFKGQEPQLNVLSGKLGLSSDGKQLVATLVINDLSTTLPPGGQANEYYMLWTSGDTQWFANAEVDASGGVVYTDGQVNGAQFAPRGSGPTDTGEFHAGKNGSVVIDVPRDAVGSPAIGSQLSAPTGETKELIGVAGVGGSLQPVDSAGPEYQYTVGETCAVTAQGSQHAGEGPSPTVADAPKTVRAAASTPNTGSGLAHGLDVPALLALCLIGLAGFRRRRAA